MFMVGSGSQAFHVPIPAVAQLLRTLALASPQPKAFFVAAVCQVMKKQSVPFLSGPRNCMELSHGRGGLKIPPMEEKTGPK